jgi:hypothetical protein
MANLPEGPLRGGSLARVSNMTRTRYPYGAQYWRIRVRGCWQFRFPGWDIIPRARPSSHSLEAEYHRYQAVRPIPVLRHTIDRRPSQCRLFGRLLCESG